MRLAVMVCAQDEAVRCQGQLPWFLNFVGLKSAAFYNKWKTGEENSAGVEKECAPRRAASREIVRDGDLAKPRRISGGRNPRRSHHPRTWSV